MPRSPGDFLIPDPAPSLQYYIRRTRYHLPALFLERRRDQLNPKTMDYEYVELVALKQIYGDVFVSFPVSYARQSVKQEVAQFPEF